MRHKRLTRAGAAALVAAAAGLLAAAAGAGPAAFGDPAGDSGTAPDITNVAVSDTGAGGAISVGVTAAPLSAGGSIEVFLNTDKDDATGSPSGSELRLEVWQEADDRVMDICRWASSDWQEVPESSSLHFSRSGSVFTWTFTRTDLGATNGFTLWAGGFMEDGDGNVLARDEAPDGGDWVYDLP